MMTLDEAARQWNDSPQWSRVKMNVTITRKPTESGAMFTFDCKPSPFYRFMQIIGLRKKGPR